MSSFWKHVGLVFASIGKYSLKGALWASQHPEVVTAVLSATNVSQKVAQPIEAGVAIVAASQQPPQNPQA